MSEFVTFDNENKTLPNISVNIRMYDKDLVYEELVVSSTLLDEGSQRSYISSKVVDKYNIPVEIVSDPLLITNATGQMMATCTKVVRNINIFVPMYEREIVGAELLVLDSLSERHIILGLDCLRPLRRKLNVPDPYYVNNVNIVKCDKNIKIQKNNKKYDEILIRLGNLALDFDAIPDDKISIKNKTNIFLRPFEHKAVAVKFSIKSLKDNLDVLDKDIYVIINDRFSNVLKLDDCKLQRNTKCIYLCNTSDKVVTVTSGTLLASEPMSTENTSNVNNLIRIDSLPKFDQKFYLKEYQEWFKLREKYISENPLKDEIYEVVLEANWPNNEFHDVLLKNNFAFARNNMDVGFSHDYIVGFEFKHEFDMTPIYIPAYRMAHGISVKIDSQLQDMLKASWIEKTNSAWSSPIMGVAKPGRTEVRVVQDYKKLNNLLELPRFPIPHPNSLKYKIMMAISKLKKYNEKICFSILDAKSAFNILNLRKEDRKFTAFTHDHRQYQFKKLVQGVKSAPAIFCHFVDTFLDELNSEFWFTFTYMDDFFNLTIESQFINSISCVLKVFIKNGITVDLKKCQFNRNSVSYIGHVVSADGFKPLPSKMEALANLPIPRTLTEAQSFQGCFAFYTSICPRIQLTLAPLASAVGKGKKSFRMNKSIVEACEQAKHYAAIGFGSCHISYDHPIFIVSDVSLVGIGAAFGNCSVTFNDNNEAILSDFRVVSYGSRPLEFTETLLSARYREMIGIQFALTTFSDFLPKLETIYALTDHASLTDAVNAEVIKSSFTRLRKAAATILEYPNLKILYVSCRDDIINLVDGLSRNRSFRTKLGELNISEEDVGLSFEINEPRKTTLNNVLHKPLRQSVAKVPLETIMEEQMNDKTCSEIKTKLLNISDSNIDNSIRVGRNEFILDKNTVYRINVKLIKEIYVPEHLVNEILSYIHSSTMHCSIDRLKYFINENNLFFMNKLSKIQMCVTHCLLCQWMSPKVNLGKNMTFIRPSIEPLTEFCVDLIDFSRFTNSEVKYFLLMSCKFSHFCDGLGLKSKNAVEVCKNLAVLIHKYSAYSVSILTDGGSEFDNKILDTYFEKFGIIGCQISAYNPMSNSQERINKEIKRIFKCLDPNETDITPFVLMAISTYNQLPMKKYNWVSPFELIYGVQSRIGLCYPSLVDDTEVFVPDDQYSELKRTQELELWVKFHENEIRRLCQEKAYKYHTLLKPELDRFNIGDYVLAYFPTPLGGHKATSFSWGGPYRVIKCFLTSYSLQHVLTHQRIKRNYKMLRLLNLSSEMIRSLEEGHLKLDKNNYILQTVDNTREDCRIEVENSDSEEEILQPRYNLRSKK